MDRYKRLVALAVTIVMLVAVMPMSTFAEETPQQGDLPETFISENEPATGAGVVDFSEMHLFAGLTDPALPNAFGWGKGSGGNSTMAIAGLTRWQDPVNETDNPYPTSSFTLSNITYNQNAQVQKHVQEVIRLPKKSIATDNALIKQAIMEYGAAYASLWWDSNYGNDYTGTYYFPQGASTDEYAGGHAITIVGWDDNYSASNFSVSPANQTPSGNGAYIIKNSWGEGAGDNGYYYVSYYDAFLATNYETDYYRSDNVTLFVGVESASNYSRQYLHDPYGAVGSIWVSDMEDSSLLYSTVFTARETEVVSAVSVYSYGFNDIFEIWVIPLGGTQTTPPSTSVIYSQTANASKTIYYPGYHTIKLDTGVSVTKGRKFAVVAAVKNPVAEAVTIPLEFNSGTFVTQASCARGQSFLYSAGWRDGYDFFTDTSVDICLRAFTSPIGTGGIPSGSSDEQQDNQEQLDEDEIESDEQQGGSDNNNLSDEDPENPLDADAVVEENQTEGENESDGTDDSFGVVSLSPELRKLPEPYVPVPLPEDFQEPPTGSGTQQTVGGAVPAPYDYFNNQVVMPPEPPTGAVPPTRYNLAEIGFVTPVKDQGGYGGCWTFATMACLESYFTRQQAVDDFDITISRTAPYLRQGSSMTIGVTATDESLVEGYAWSFSGGGFGAFQGEGNRSVTFSAAPGAMENIINGSCTATLTSGIEVKKDFTIALTDYGATADGSAANPYQVNTAKKLELINGFLGEDFKEVHFVQTADIDLEGNAWTPIGYYRSETDKLPFMGSYDGGGYVISRLIPDITDASYSKAIGLFGYTKDAQIRNVTINNYDRRTEYTFDTNDYSTPFWFGGFAGYTENTALTDCTTAVALRVPNSINVTAGGLVGKMKGGSMDHCATTYTDLYYSSIAPGQNITMGGLIGETDGASVTKCYSDLLVDYHAVSNLRIGGLIGLAANGTQVSDSFVIGYVAETVVNSTPVRTTAGLAFIGTGTKNSFTRCYAYTPFVLNDRYGGSTGYTLFGGNTGASGLSQSYCFYNKDVVGSASKMGTDKTTVQMGTQSAFSGFDFTNNWTMIQGNQHWSGISSFPALKNPLGALMGDYGLYPTAIFSGETVQINGTQNPYHVWLQQVGAETTHPEIVLVSNGGGVLTGGKYGVTSVMLVAGGAGGTVLKTIDNFTVITRPGDLNFTGTPQYPQAIALLLDLLTGKLADYEHYYVLNADRTDDKVFDVTRDDISLSDLVTMKQRAVGAYVRPL